MTECQCVPGAPRGVCVQSSHTIPILRQGHHYFPKAGQSPGKFWKVTHRTRSQSSGCKWLPGVLHKWRRISGKQDSRLCSILLHQLVTMVNCIPSPAPSLTICTMDTVQPFCLPVAGASGWQPVRCLMALAASGLLHVMVLKTSHLSNKAALQVLT